MVSMSEFLKENSIDFIYKYSEVRSDKKTVLFGWQVAEEIDTEQPLVISYYSRSKFATDEEVESAKKEKTNVASLEDYRKFFVALTSQEPEVFLARWNKKNLHEFYLHWKSNYPHADEKQPLFIFKLANLICHKKKFVMYGRGFKVFEPIKVENEKRDETGEV
jgi:hypothetical protein